MEETEENRRVKRKKIRGGNRRQGRQEIKSKRERERENRGQLGEDTGGGGGGGGGREDKAIELPCTLRREQRKQRARIWLRTKRTKKKEKKKHH